VAKRAQRAKIPVLLLAGSKGAGWEALRKMGVSAVLTLAQEGENLQELMRNADEALTRLTVRACLERPWA
jgi:glycerate kinase